MKYSEYPNSNKISEITYNDGRMVVYFRNGKVESCLGVTPAEFWRFAKAKNADTYYQKLLNLGFPFLNITPPKD